MDDLGFYSLQSGTTQSEVSLLRRLLPELDTVPWPYGSKKVPVRSEPLPDSRRYILKYSGLRVLKGEKESSSLVF